MKNAKKLTTAALLVACGVVFSTFYIPIGAAKCFPIQHMINLLAGILLGPAYAVGMAFSTSLLRNILGTGSLLAFPGSMIGAFCCGMLYKYTKKLTFAYLGEVIGTGILGALVAFPVATLILSKDVALFAYVIPFILSTFGGLTISILLINVLQRTKVLSLLKTSIDHK